MSEGTLFLHFSRLRDLGYNGQVDIVHLAS